MNKTELLSTYTPEQLADMLIKANNLLDMLKYSDSFLKTGLFDNLTAAALEARLNIAQNRIKNLEEEKGRLQAEVDTYNKYLIPRCTKEARRMIDKNRFAEVRIVTWDEWNNRGKDSMNISGIQKCQEEYEKLLKESPIQGIVDGIAKDILKQKNNAMAMEFTKAICGLLEKNGVRISCTETKHQNITHDLIEEKYGIIFDSVDFSRHDKEFKDKIEELKKQLGRRQTTINQFDEIMDELFGVTHDMEKLGAFKEILKEKVNEKISDFLPTEPIKIADMLISATYTRQKGSMEKTLHKAFGNNSDTLTENVYSKSELRQIAEHLLAYCSHNEGGEMMKDNVHEMAIKMSEQVKGVSVYIDGRYVNALDVSTERKHLETPDGVVFMERVDLTVANIQDIAYVMNEETFEKFCKLWREYHGTER